MRDGLKKTKLTFFLGNIHQINMKNSFEFIKKFIVKELETCFEQFITY